jgi:hypothetical protein
MSPVATSRSFSNPKKAAKRATSHCSETGRIAPVAWQAAIKMLSAQCPSHRSSTLAKRIGINAILSKPVEPETLLETVRGVLG